MEKGEECSRMGIIERGTVLASDGNKYNVLSLDRPGISILSITPVGDTAYSIGDKVVFISFPDGTGKILCEL